jgi:hypothetical protein
MLHGPCHTQVYINGEFVGGADANQNGFGDLIPAKFIDKSTIFYLLYKVNFFFVVIKI